MYVIVVKGRVVATFDTQSKAMSRMPRGAELYYLGRSRRLVESQTLQAKDKASKGTGGVSRGRHSYTLHHYLEEGYTVTRVA